MPVSHLQNDQPNYDFQELFKWNWKHIFWLGEVYDLVKESEWIKDLIICKKKAYVQLNAIACPSAFNSTLGS